MSPEIPVTRRPSTPLPIGTGQDEPSGVIDQRGYGPQPDRAVSVDAEGCVSVPGVTIEKKEDADRRLAEENERRTAENAERDVLQDLFRDEVDLTEVEAALDAAAEGEEEEEDEDDDAAQPD